MLCTPSRSNSKESQASGNTTEQTTDDMDSPTPQRPRRNTARTQLYQSSEEAHKEKEKRRRAYQRTPRKSKHAPYDRRSSYKTMEEKESCVFLRVATNALFMAFPVVHDVCYVKGR